MYTCVMEVSDSSATDSGSEGAPPHTSRKKMVRKKTMTKARRDSKSAGATGMLVRKRQKSETVVREDQAGGSSESDSRKAGEPTSNWQNHKVSRLARQGSQFDILKLFIITSSHF